MSHQRNEVLIAGNLTRDPELRHTPSGIAVCEISVATNRSYKDKDDQKQEEATFVEVTFWGQTAEAAAKTLSKGRGVILDGRLKLDTWDDKETGKKRSKLRVVSHRFDYLDPKPEHHGVSASGGDGAVSRPINGSSFTDDDNSEIPF